MRYLICFLASLLLLPASYAGSVACYDRCDTSMGKCGFTASCEAVRQDCTRRCDPDQRRPSKMTRQRLNQSPEELQRRLAGPSKDRMSGCAVRCETTMSACVESNSDAAPMCADARSSCLSRCEGKGKKKKG